MSRDSKAQPSIDIGRYWSVLVSRWAVVAAGPLVGVLIAAAYLLVVPTTYTATTTLAVYPITTDPYAANRNSNNLIDMDAEVVTASSFKVAEAAVEALGSGWDATELRRQTQVTAAAGSTTLNIEVDAGSEELARAGAAAMAAAYLQTRADQAATSIESVVTRDRERIEALRVQLTEAIGRLAKEPAGSPAAAEASADQQLINLQITALLSRTSSLEGIDTTGGAILNPARLTTIMAKPSRVNVLATGLAAGLVVGIVLAFFSHSRRKTVRGTNDLHRELEIETIGSWSDEDEADSRIDSAAERILHLAAARDARCVVLLSGGGEVDPPDTAQRITASLRSSHDDVVHEMPGVEAAERLRVVLVPADISQANRLRALRRSDLVVLIAARGVTRIKAVAALQEEAQSMGAEIDGAIVAPALRERSNAKERKSARERSSATGRSSATESSSATERSSTSAGSSASARSSARERRRASATD